MRDTLKLPVSLAAALTIMARPPLSPRFAEMPWSTREPRGYRGRKTKKNLNATKQANAKRARKITRRHP